MRLAFRRAQIIYVLHQLEQGMKQFSRLSMTARLRKLLADPRYRDRVNDCFARGSISGLLQIDPLEREIKWRSEHQRHVKFEIEFAKCRLAFIDQKEDERLSSAKLYMEMARSEGVVGLSIGGRYTGYRSRAAYLLAADALIPDLLSFQEDELYRPGDHVPNATEFSAYCMLVRTIANMLKCPGDEQLQRWTGLDMAALLELPTIPPKVVNQWIGKHHNPAEETKVGKEGRQRPVTRRG